MNVNNQERCLLVRSINYREVLIMMQRFIESLGCCITPVETFTLQMSVPLIDECKFISVDLILYKDKDNMLQHVFDAEGINSEPFLSNVCFDLENREDMDIVTRRIEKALNDNRQLSFMLSDINYRLKVVIDGLMITIKEQMLNRVKKLFNNMHVEKDYIDYDYSYYNEPCTNSLGN